MYGCPGRGKRNYCFLLSIWDGLFIVNIFLSEKSHNYALRLRFTFTLYALRFAFTLYAFRLALSVETKKMIEDARQICNLKYFQLFFN